MKYLITGGSGSFGRAFTKRLLEDPSVERIGVLSRGEHAQAEMAEQIKDARLRFLIGDVRDLGRLRRAFDGVDVVVHAAALKRIEVGQYCPSEVVQTNIIGTQNVIEACIDQGVAKAVFLSTDKAYQPVSPYGQSKALAETLFRNAYQGSTKFAVTRYGNVWGSKGSVVPRWREILKISDTVPVTDPEATRFFMRMSEAVDLVQTTIEMMQGGELNIPTLPAYRLGDLAEAMGAKMNIIGMQDYEKRHEGMCDGNTSDAARRMSIDELRAVLDEDSSDRPSTFRLDEAAFESALAPEWSDGTGRSLGPVWENFRDTVNGRGDSGLPSQ